ncbi:MAG: serine/threonine protein kinase [Polyangiaceae bacterium]|nr:serine/threonine protein kinase [Polyangiaceae bacterium]
MALREVRELGRGTFGRVYLADDDVRGGQVAVKELLDPEADLDRFEREVRLLIDQINNRYVVDIYGYDLKAERPYLVMEYCDGGSLRQFVGKAAWPQAATMLLHAAQGLLGIHSVGGFHRDLKPDNLLIGRSPGVDGYVVKVADFGLARRPKTAQLPMTRTPGGTPGYMAPELSAPGAQFTTSADAYSLGIIGTELLTGSLSPDKLTQVDIPENLRNLLRRMVSPLPFFRPATADLIIALGQIIRVDQPVPAPPRDPAPPPPRSNDGNGLLWLLGLAGLAAAGAALAAGNKGDWDDNVGRRRGSDGRFKRS